MKIDKSTVDYIAKLAKLNLTDEKSEKMAKEFEAILTHFQSLNNADLEDVKIDYKDNIKSVFRKDETSIFEDKKKLLQNVKSLEGSSIKVPKIIE